MSATPPARRSPGEQRHVQRDVHGRTGFSGTVNLSVTGVPTQCHRDIQPRVDREFRDFRADCGTDSNVHKRARTLTITGTSGGRVQTVNVTLIIQ